MSIRLLLALSWNQIACKKNENYRWDSNRLIWGDMGTPIEAQCKHASAYRILIYKRNRAAATTSPIRVNFLATMFDVWCNVEISNHDRAKHVLIWCGGVHRISWSTCMLQTRARQRKCETAHPYVRGRVVRVKWCMRWHVIQDLHKKPVDRTSGAVGEKRAAWLLPPVGPSLTLWCLCKCSWKFLILAVKIATEEREEYNGDWIHIQDKRRRKKTDLRTWVENNIYNTERAQLTPDFHWAAVILVPLDFGNQLFLFQLQLFTLETWTQTTCLRKTRDSGKVKYDAGDLRERENSHDSPTPETRVVWQYHLSY